MSNSEYSDVSKDMSANRKKSVKQHQLYVVRPKVWRKLRRANKIDKDFIVRAREIGFFSYLSYPFQWLQRFLFDKEIKKVSLIEKPPLFILGHWRSGTTHLHYLLSKDTERGYLSNYQGFIFNVAFLSKTRFKKLVGYFFPTTRPQDNIKVSPDDPAEEEQPLCTMSVCSGIHSFFFPKNRSYFDKYNVFKGISAKEKADWQKNYRYLLQGISLYNDNKPLLLKNPHNTGRVKELLELYPNAKFVYIHRNPYSVYRSTMHLYESLIYSQFLQDFTHEELHNLVIYNFKETLGKYINEKDLIPKENLVEVSYQELDENPMPTLARIYDELGLDNFEEAKPNFVDYLKTVKNYKKNKFHNLSDEVIKSVNKEWDFFFSHFNYTKI